MNLEKHARQMVKVPPLVEDGLLILQYVDDTVLSMEHTLEE